MARKVVLSLATAALLGAGVLACLPSPDGEPPSTPSVLLGVLLCVLATAGVTGPESRRIWARSLTLVALGALVAFHAVSLVTAPTRTCDCLPALGYPGHQRILLGCSLVLAAYALFVNPLEAFMGRTRRRIGAGATVVVLLGALWGWHGATAPWTERGESQEVVVGSAPETDAPALRTAGRVGTPPAQHGSPATVDDASSDRWQLRVRIEGPENGREVYVTAVGTPERQHATIEDGVAVVTFAASHGTKPPAVVAELDGFRVRRATVAWNESAEGPRGQAFLRFESTAANRVVALVQDGAGHALAGLRVVATPELDQRLCVEAAERGRRVAEQGLELAIATSDELGRVTIDDWASDTISIEALTPGWERIDEFLAPHILARMHKAAQAGRRADLSDVTPSVQKAADKPLFKFARLAFAGVRVELGEHPSPPDNPTQWVRIAASKVQEPPCDGWQRQYMATRHEQDAPVGVLSIGQYLVLDSTCREIEGAPAGWVELESIGYVRTRVPIAWTFVDAPRVTRASLQPARRGSFGPIGVQLGDGLSPLPMGTQVKVKVVDVDTGVETSCLARVNDDQRLVLGVEVPAGQYEIHCPLWRDVARVAVSGGAAAWPTVSVQPVAGLSVRVLSPASLLRREYGVVAALQRAPASDWRVAVDVVLGADPVALRSLPDGMDYWFADVPPSMYVGAGGPTLTAEPTPVRLTRGKVVQADLRLVVREKR